MQLCWGTVPGLTRWCLGLTEPEPLACKEFGLFSLFSGSLLLISSRDLTSLFPTFLSSLIIRRLSSSSLGHLCGAQGWCPIGATPITCLASVPLVGSLVPVGAPVSMVPAGRGEPKTHRSSSFGLPSCAPGLRFHPQSHCRDNSAKIEIDHFRPQGSDPCGNHVGTWELEGTSCRQADKPARTHQCLHTDTQRYVLTENIHMNTGARTHMLVENSHT